MSYFDQVYQRIFGGSTGSNVSRILVDDLLKRSQSFLDKFTEWKASGHCEEFLNDLWQSYYWRKKGIDKTPEMHILESTHSNGIAINYTREYGKNTFQYLFDYLAEQVKKLDYKLVVSRQTIQEKGSTVEMKEMHYLKPRNTFIQPMDQKYGNVQIEYIAENDEPKRIKLVVNSYPDRHYTTPKKFEDLAAYIFSFKNS